MTIAIMQPYLFPYIGYFQLLHAVDRFVAYDDVTFIKQGWINRNNILLNGAPHLFTVPLANASSNALISDTEISQRVAWQPKLLKTLQQAYRKAPAFAQVYPLIENVISGEQANMSKLAVNALKIISGYLGLTTEIIESSGH